jgi:Ca2+-binding RTX toxin-like protein
MPFVVGTNGSETLNFANGVTNNADTIFGLGGDDDIFGLGGNDVILGGLGADEINGGSGIDTASYSDSVEGVSVSLLSNPGFGGTAEGDILVSIENLAGSNHDDYLTGNNGSNVLTGRDGNDNLSGGGGADTLFGDSDHDTLKGGGGADTLNGGSGIDTASYYDSPAGVIISLISNIADSGDATGDELNSIENVTGSAHDDTLWGNDDVNVLKGLDGRDSLKGFGGADMLYGGDDNDELFGMDGVDTLRGEDGNDTLDGGAGGDTMIGGADNDHYYIDNAADAVTENSGEGFADAVHAGITYVLPANVEYLYLTGTANISGYGNALANQVVGNDGNNLLDGLGGADVMAGGDGHDAYFVDDAGDTVYEYSGKGTDAVYSTISYALTATTENLYLQGAGDLHGAGNALANFMQGNTGNNTLNGGASADVIEGGLGNDTFVFNAGQANGDTITDFNGNGAAAGDQIQFVGYGPDVLFYSISATQWQLDYNGGMSHEIITLSNAAAPDGSDFSFI